jgi:hypothetical protein
MPSNLKYRIKCASVSELSMFNQENIPADRYAELVDTGYLTPSDLNILPHTCAFITKVSDDQVAQSLHWVYLCGIKRWTMRYDLIASNTPKANSTQTQEFEGRVSGALALVSSSPFSVTSDIGINYTEDSIIRRDFFICRYCDRNTGKATKHGIAGEEFVEFPMCNCYSPRGGMAISVFDGAVQGQLATGYVPDPLDPTKQKEFANVYNIWDVYKNPAAGSPPNYAGAIPKNLADNLPDKMAFQPKLAITYMMLNARALIAPCCWWVGSQPYLFTEKDFRVIDLAVAMEYAAKHGDSYLSQYTPTMSTIGGISDRAQYIVEVGDYWFEGNVITFEDGTEYALTREDAYTLNSLFGRRYDWTLPDCGNNQRIIYALAPRLTVPSNRLLPEDRNQPGCKPTWHIHAQGAPLSPKNCSHPDCNTKYTWGHVCNGGGAFSLSDGRACPYYQNPLMGDKDTEKRYSKLQNMYPGDSVTAAAMLEIMWMSKGGLPWTEEEWKSTWLNPYIWTTVPFSPVHKLTKQFIDDSGNVVEDFLHYEYEIYSRKTKIDPKTGKIELLPMRKLPGGSVSVFKRKQDQTMEDGLQVPDIPTIIRKIDVRPTGQLRIIWPCPSLSDLNLAVTDTVKYQESLIKLKTKVYSKVIWDRKGFVTNIVGQAMRGQYKSGVYCLNTAFIQGVDDSGVDWLRYREELENQLINLEITSDTTQDLLQKLWRTINKSQIAGNKPVIKNFSLLKTSLDSRGMFVFPEVPLSPLDNPNHIIVFGFSSATKIDADIVRVKPVFRHAWTYQKNTKLMTSWKAVWNGRPSLFLNEKYLRENISEPVDKGALAKGGTVVKLGQRYYSTTTDKFVSAVSSLKSTVNNLKNDIDAILLRLKSSSLSADETTELNATLKQKQNELVAAQQSLTEAEKSSYAQSIKTVTTDTDKEELIKEIDKRLDEIKAEKKDLEGRRDRYAKNGEADRAAVLTSQIDDLEKERVALEKKKTEAAATAIPDPVDISKDQKISTTKYSYKDKKKNTSKGDTDTNEDGIVKVETASTAATTSIAAEDPIARLYIPFLNSDRTEFRNIDKYKTIDRSNTSESIRLTIPEESGVIEWDYLMVNQEQEDDLVPLKTFPAKALKKVVVYSTRESDKLNLSPDPTKPRGAKITDKIAKWYKCSACASTIILVVNPELCNANTEFMIFGMEAILKQKYKDADGQWQTKDKKIKFIPMDYSQVTRPFPGFTVGKIAKNIGSMTKDEVDYAKIEISEFIEVLEKEVTGRHPWVFFASPVDEKEYVKEWRHYNNQWNPVDATPITIPDKTEVELYMEYAYIAEMYDENEAEAYDWENGAFEDFRTRILFSSPKAGIMRTVFGYEPGDGTTIDEYDQVPIGSHTVATIWPYARYACRDYEITYVWRDNYRGEELTTGNLKNRTATNYAASFVANKTKGKDRVFTMSDQGDHDLGTEFQPKLTYNSSTSTNVQGGNPRFHVERAEWSSNFEDQTQQYLTNKDPTYGFPYQEGEIRTAPDNVGALYYPYTRAEASSAFVPRHKTYAWDFLDRWRNKPDDPKDFGSFRMQAYDWCVKGTDVVRIRQWSRHWIYDTKRETQFLGRSRTRGPVFQLEYREYFDLPTKTVFLRPYAATSATVSDQYYCSACNRYFTKDAYGGGVCPLCGVKEQITKRNAWQADWMYLVDRVDSEPVELKTGAEQLTTAELKAFVPDDPSKESYTEWTNRVTLIYRNWKAETDENKSATLLDSMQREQARGKLRGWVVNYNPDLNFVNDIAAQETSAQEEALKTLSQKSEVNMLTGCDKYGDKKRLDLGAFQLSDEYVPGSVTPYYGSDPASRGEFEYLALEEKAREAERESEKQEAEYKKFQYYQDMIKASPNATVTYSDGTTYGSSVRAQQSAGSTPGGALDIEKEYNDAVDEEEAKKKDYDDAQEELTKYQDVLKSLQDIQVKVNANPLRTFPFVDGKIYANKGQIQDISPKVASALADKTTKCAIAAATVPPYSDRDKNYACDVATNYYNSYKAYQDSMELNPERVLRGPDDGINYGKLSALTDPATSIAEQEQKISTQQSIVDTKKTDYESAKQKRESLEETRDRLYGQPDAVVTDPVTGKSYGNKSTVQSIDTKVQEQEKKKSEAKKKATEARSKVEQLNQKTARGQARNELNQKTQVAREKIEKQCMRYYEYQQTAFGYNCPWSPYDSPPLFGNVGRELFALDICTVGGIISWLPRPTPTIISTAPTIPSWWTSRDPDGIPREMVVMLSPPTECTRALSPLSSDPSNPFYSYLFTGKPFSEKEPDIADPTADNRTIFPSPETAKDIRIVTEHDTSSYGQPYIRSDAGRFSLTVTSGSKMRDIYVTTNSPSQLDSQDMATDGYTTTELTQVTNPEKYPDPYIDGSQVRGFSVIKNERMYVGQRYPGHAGPYDYGKFFVGYKRVDGNVVGWAWPGDVRDQLLRAKRVVRWHPDLLPPVVTTSGITESPEPVYLTDVVEGQGLWSIPTLQCAPYYKKVGLKDDGREVSGGPALKEKTPNSNKIEKEKEYVDTPFAIIAESERVDENGMLRPPLVWVETLSSPDVKEIGQFKVPSTSNVMVHRVTNTGQLVPVTMEKGDEYKKDDKGFPLYKTAFSTGAIKDIASFDYNATGGANLMTVKGKNEAAKYPGFVAGLINYRTIGKVYVEKEAPLEWYNKLKVKKERSIAGQNQHKISTRFVLKNFFSNLLFVELTFNSWFEESNLSNYLTNSSDVILAEISVGGTAVPGGDPAPTTIFTTQFPIKKDPTTDGLKVIYNCDFGITNDLVIDFVLWVRVDPGVFNLGIWKAVPETKRELTVTWTPVRSEDPPYSILYWESHETWSTISDPSKYCYLSDLIDKMVIGVLRPGKCAEVVVVKETKFGVSEGKESSVDGRNYNFFTECKTDSYKPNWEEFDKQMERSEGWWKQSNKLTEEDAKQAGVTDGEQWMVKAETNMYERLRQAEEDTSTGGLYDAHGKKKQSAIGKEPAAQIFPRVCAEVPELPISRLKINAWNALNNNNLPDTRDPYEWPQTKEEKSWAWGGIWTTRMAGPEWVTADQYPTRDMIWWPALPYLDSRRVNTGEVILKGQYFKFAHQYKDESKVINKDERRGVDTDDTFNENAYKYEVRGFDALIKTIETVEQTTAEDRRSAAYSREYGVSYAQRKAAETGTTIPNRDRLDLGNLMSALGGGWGAHTLTDRNFPQQMAQGAVDAINQAANAPNYRVSDQRNWVFLDEINMKVDQVNWEQIKKREEKQKELWEEAEKLGNDLESKVTFTSIIPYHEWNELLSLSGYYLIKIDGFASRGFRAFTTAHLKEKKCDSCVMEWKTWEWEEIASFSFRNEEETKYPLKAQVSPTWKTLLVRKCGSKWAHKDQEIDGGKIWTKWDEVWKDFMERGRARVKLAHPVIVSYDCKRKKDVSESEQNLEHFEDAGDVECKELKQKWTGDAVTSWPSTVSNDGGSTLNRPDPWWRF